MGNSKSIFKRNATIFPELTDTNGGVHCCFRKLPSDLVRYILSFNGGMYLCGLSTEFIDTVTRPCSYLQHVYVEYHDHHIIRYNYCRRDEKVLDLIEQGSRELDQGQWSTGLYEIQRRQRHCYTIFIYSGRNWTKRTSGHWEYNPSPIYSNVDYQCKKKFHRRIDFLHFLKLREGFPMINKLYIEGNVHYVHDYLGEYIDGEDVEVGQIAWV